MMRMPPIQPCAIRERADAGRSFMKRRRLPILALLGTAVTTLACAKPPVVVPATRDAAIEIDGAYGDWDGQFTRIDAKRSVGLGLAHDDANLYISLVTRDLGVQTLLRRAGFTLWLDPAGGQRKKIGLRVAPIDDEENHAEPGEEITPRIEIVRDGAEYGYQLANPGPDAAVDAKTSHNADVIAYEFRLAMKSPLAESLPGSSIGIAPGAKLGIGVVTEKLPDPTGSRPLRIEEVRTWVVGDLGTRD